MEATMMRNGCACWCLQADHARKISSKPAALPASPAAKPSASTSSSNNSSSASPSTSADTPPAQQDAINAGMSTVMTNYERELKSPIRHLIAGDLGRTLLIQVGVGPVVISVDMNVLCCTHFCQVLLHRKADLISFCWHNGMVTLHQSNNREFGSSLRGTDPSSNWHSNAGPEAQGGHGGSHAGAGSDPQGGLRMQLAAETSSASCYVDNPRLQNIKY